jgi:hypothetical protein
VKPPRIKPQSTPPELFMTLRDSLVEDIPTKLSNTIRNTYLMTSLIKKVDLTSLFQKSKDKIKFSPLKKSQPWSWLRWNKSLNLTQERKLKTQLLPSQLISITHKDKLLKMPVSLPVLTSSEFLTSQLPLLLPMVLTKKKKRTSWFSIWEEEHSMSQSLPSMTEFSKLLVLTVTLIWEVKILIKESWTTSWN